MSEKPESKEKSHSESDSVSEQVNCEERLDRESPEIWPQAIPGVQQFVQEHGTTTAPSSWATRDWAKGLTEEDMKEMQRLGSLSTSGLIVEIKKLYDSSYQLGLDEAKEMTRGKYLNIFTAPSISGAAAAAARKK